MIFLWNIGESLNHNFFRELRRCMCASCDTGINRNFSYSNKYNENILFNK